MRRFDATATTSPRSSINNALLDVVDVSMPRKYMIYSPGLLVRYWSSVFVQDQQTSDNLKRTPNNTSTVN
jgi:hypothetical protein